MNSCGDRLSPSTSALPYLLTLFRFNGYVKVYHSRGVVLVGYERPFVTSKGTSAYCLAAGFQGPNGHLLQGSGFPHRP